MFGVSDPALDHARASMERDGLSHLALGPAEARLLQTLLRLREVRTVVELGTLYGYSTLAMAAALPPGGRVITIEADPYRHDMARRHFAQSTYGDRVEAILGRALEQLSRLDQTFDAIFMDANKREYPLYLDWAEAHVRRGGLILGDNTFLYGAVYDEPSRPTTGRKQTEAMKTFNKRLADPKRYDSTIIPTREGLIVALKRF